MFGILGDRLQSGAECKAEAPCTPYNFVFSEFMDVEDGTCGSLISANVRCFEGGL
jgi:hypothetical protein